MPIFVLTFVAVPWAASKAGRLIRSGLDLIGTNLPRANPAESVPHDLPVIVPLPAQTYFQDRSFSGLRMLHQNDDRSPNQLPDENKQEKQEQDSTSATSKTDISSQSLKLPPFQDRSFSGLRMLHQNNVRSRTLLLDENKQEKQEQDSSFATSKTDISSQSELKMLQQNDDRSPNQLPDENKREKQEQDSSFATSKTDISSQSELKMLQQNDDRSPNQLPDENKREKQEQDSSFATSKTDISSQSLKLPPFQDRSFSGLRMLHQNNVRSRTLLLDENKQEKQEQDSSFATSKTDISSQSLKLPPFQDRSFSGLRMLHQNNVRSRTLLLDENKQEKEEQDSSFATSKTDISSQSELKMLQQNDDRSPNQLPDENKQEKQEQDSSFATSKTDISSQSELKMLQQNDDRSPNQLPDENKQEKQEQVSTSATSKTDISSQSLKLPPFQDRSFSGLRMLHQNNVRSRTLLLDENKQEKQEQDSSFATSKTDISSQSELKMLQQNDDRSPNQLPDENKQEKQEQDSTSATSKTDISSQSLKLPRLALYMSVHLYPFASCGGREGKSGKDLTPHELADRWMKEQAQFAAAFYVTYDEILACMKKYKERQQMVLFPTKVAVFFRAARARIMDLWFRVVERITSVFAKAQAPLPAWIFDRFNFLFIAAVLSLIYFFIYRKRPTMTAVFSSTEEFPAVFPQLKQQEMYLPGNKRELLISFPHPQKRLQLFYPESKEGWTIVLKRPEHQMRLLLPGHLQGLQMVFPLSKQELPVPFPRPVEELLLLFPQSEQGIRVFFPGLTGRIRAAFFGAQRRLMQVVSWTRSRIAAGLLSASEQTLTLFDAISNRLAVMFVRFQY
uniref:uncharacterized protein DDB_G0290301-like isoform X4 n=1 Tax=Scatophagus argus TaxID=75038 RepID=UPI001ED855AC|nr:uncharacterized protein DDB_G0290301-like isoform X4 [Scatophagus argus]XP_046231922.1 uncharacterized protein DDB_G0290301-like isoform X5 [Scatophagus argus]